MSKLVLNRPDKSAPRVERVSVRNTPINDRDIFTFAEACDYLRVSPSFLRGRVKDNDVPYARLGARKIIFSRLALLDWIQQRHGVVDR